MWPDPQFTADLVTFTREILNGKVHFFVQCCSTKIRSTVTRGVFGTPTNI